MTDEETMKTGALLQRIAKECSVVVVEHDMEFVRSFAAKVTVMHEGKSLKEGSMQEIQRDPLVAEVYLGKGGRRMLKPQGIESGYGESSVLRGVSMVVDPAKVVCLVGRNGVGKTTLMRTLTGQLKIRQGRMTLGEQEVTGWDSVKEREAALDMFRRARDFPQLTVKENLSLGLEPIVPRRKAFPEDVLALFPVPKCTTVKAVI